MFQRDVFLGKAFNPAGDNDSVASMGQLSDIIPKKKKKKVTIKLPEESDEEPKEFKIGQTRRRHQSMAIKG